jgi:hypothetical protein
MASAAARFLAFIGSCSHQSLRIAPATKRHRMPRRHTEETAQRVLLLVTLISAEVINSHHIELIVNSRELSAII